MDTIVFIYWFGFFASVIFLITLATMERKSLWRFDTEDVRDILIEAVTWFVSVPIIVIYNIRVVKKMNDNNR